MLLYGFPLKKKFFKHQVLLAPELNLRTTFQFKSWPPSNLENKAEAVPAYPWTSLCFHFVVSEQILSSAEDWYCYKM